MSNQLQTLMNDLRARKGNRFGDVVDTLLCISYLAAHAERHCPKLARELDAVGGVTARRLLLAYDMGGREEEVLAETQAILRAKSGADAAELLAAMPAASGAVN